MTLSFQKILKPERLAAVLQISEYIFSVKDSQPLRKENDGKAGRLVWQVRIWLRILDKLGLETKGRKEKIITN